MQQFDELLLLVRVPLNKLPNHQCIFNVKSVFRIQACLFKQGGKQHGIPFNNAFFRAIHPGDILVTGIHQVDFTIARPGIR